MVLRIHQKGTVKTKDMKGAIVLLLLLASLSYSQALSVGFGEVDYQAVEGNGGRYAVIEKSGTNVGDLVLTVMALRYDEVAPDQVPAEKMNFPDAAEYEKDGRKDFYRVVETVVFKAGSGHREKQVFFPFYDDDINENTEGYFAVVRVNESASHPKDVAALKYNRNGITLIVINDDDDIKLSFESDKYTVSESDGVQNNLISVCKEDGVVSERTLKALIQLHELSDFDAAKRGKDFEIDSAVKTITFFPDDDKIYLPFAVKEDTIAEALERFNLLLSVPIDEGWKLGKITFTNVYIEDNDEAVIGFEEEEYRAKEEDGSVEVCVKLFSPDQIEFFITGSVKTVQDTALEGSDFTPINELFVIFDEQLRVCFSIPLTDDTVAEPNEKFSLTLSLDSPAPRNVAIARAKTTVIIADGDFNIPPQCECDVNAKCIDISETKKQCVCNQGYTGNGKTCTDIDECLEGTHRCSSNAHCINTPGSYQCECKEGFKGNGVTCQDIDECHTKVHTCSKYASCVNTIGSFQCHCKKGFTGNGVTCIDINECRTKQHECDHHAYCINTIGDYNCVCKRGYIGDGFICHKPSDEKTRTRTRSRTSKSRTKKTHTKTKKTRTRDRSRTKTKKTKTTKRRTHKKSRTRTRH